MSEISQLVGLFVIIYCVIVGMVMLITKCSVEDARKKISSFFRENDYELSRDGNYKQSVNDIVKDILGKSRYEELCNLDKYSMTLQFLDNHDGLPCVQITLNSNDENEKKRLEAILESTTRKYLLNYKVSFTKLLSEWSYNEILRLPMLRIMYSRNEKEFQMLENSENSQANIISAKYGDVLDDTDDDLL